MLLYHGSNVAVEKPLLIPARRLLDFGAGFYLTSDMEQAKSWAFLKQKRARKGKPTVSVFEFDENATQELSVLKFDSASENWLFFVSNCRNKPDFTDEHDIVIGPVADDKTMPVLRFYFSGIYDEKETIKRLLPQVLKNQYAFKSRKALSALSFKEAIFL